MDNTGLDCYTESYIVGHGFFEGMCCVTFSAAPADEILFWVLEEKEKKMCDTAAFYWIKIAWVDGVIDQRPYRDPPFNTVQNIRSYSEWMQILSLTDTELCETMTNQPGTFELVSPPLPVPYVVHTNVGDEYGTATEGRKFIPTNADRLLIEDSASVPPFEKAYIEIGDLPSGSGGVVDSVVGGTGIDVDATDPANPIVSLQDTVVTPGSYTNLFATVDQQGRITAASSGTTPVTSVTATAPITSTGGTTPVIASNNSVGGNAAADAGKLLKFGADGSIQASTGIGGGAAVYGETSVLNGPAVQGYSTNGGDGGRFQSVGGKGVAASSDTGAAIQGTSDTGPGLHVNVTDVGNTTDLALFHRDDNLGAEIRNDGAIDWTSATGANATLNNALPDQTGHNGQFLVTDGANTSWASTPDEFCIITDDCSTVTIAGDLTVNDGGTSTLILGQDNTSDGDNTAVFGRANTINGTGSATENSIVFGTGGTITNAVNAALFSLSGAPNVTTGASFNVYAAQIIMASSDVKLPSFSDGILTTTGGTGTVASLTTGTGVQTALGVNVGSAGAVVVNGGALGTPSSGVATNLTGTAAGLSIGGNAAMATLASTVTTNANLTGPITSVGNATTIADAELAAIAGLTSAANKIIQFTGSGTAALVDQQNGVEVAYTGTDSYTAGAAPSSTSSKRQIFTLIGNTVNFQISITYATGGTTLTNFLLTLPAEFPTPLIPSGFTGASVKLYRCSGMAITTPSGTVTPTVSWIGRNAADNGFEITGNAFASGTLRTFIVTGSYFTA